MWKRAKKDLSKYPEAVLNAKDAEGRGVSVRQRELAFDVATGTMPVKLPSSLGAVAGPATLLGHFHDDKVWNMHTMSIRGTLEQRAGQWVFVASSYQPARIMDFLRGTRVSARKYLERRGLPWPKPNYEVINRLFEEAGKISDP